MIATIEDSSSIIFRRRLEIDVDSVIIVEVGFVFYGTCSSLVVQVPHLVGSSGTHGSQIEPPRGAEG